MTSTRTSSEHVSVLFPQQPHDADELRPFADLVQDGPAARLWMGQSLAVETHATFSYLAGTGYRIPVGICVALAALRHPFDAALQARSVARLMGHAPTIGYGAADPGFVSRLHGAPYAKPAAFVREYVGAVAALIDGGVPTAGTHFRIAQPLPPMEAPAVEVGAGVLRPGMAKAAGRTASAAITWMTPPGYVRDVLVPALDAGADGTRPRPRVVTVVHAAVARPGRNPMLLAQHSAGNHLRAPHYTDMLRRAGLDVDAADPVSGARELVDEGVYLYGKPGDITAGLRAYFDAGVDEVILNPMGVSAVHGPEAGLEDLRDILAEVG
ncbi:MULTISPECIES: LLM class flavin-dependent oxidoreductase [unclassified Streptomyces]|uniref:LLM class flavin-dependent oxidoreductase n=1 Tax=unclassified Streptomyces TaxID=2593676 RepID=UPI002E27CBF7|nr:LLM class flavin-dependent oxidoreductase [Streptomyces sp. NBC_00223]